MLQAERKQGSLERQLLLLARSSGSAGFTINDALLAVPDPALGSKRVRSEIDRLLRAELLDVANDAIDTAVLQAREAMSQRSADFAQGRLAMQERRRPQFQGR